LSKYKYVGTECFYPNIIIPGEGSLVAHPGDVREFDTPPDTTWWVKEDEPAKPAVKSAPDKDTK